MKEINKFETNIRFSTDLGCATQSHNKRSQKGNDIRQFVEDYCILDLETTSVYIDEAEIIEVAILKVRNNIIVSKYSTLICPDCKIPEEASRINKITDDMVKDSPALEEVIDDILDFIGQDVIVGHNINRYDVNLLYDKVLSLNNIHFTNDFIDTLEMAKRSNIPTVDNKLSTLAEYFGEAILGEHRAMKDCELNKVVYEKLWESFGDNCFTGTFIAKNPAKENRGYIKPQYSENTLAIQELNSISQKILQDETVSASEAEELNDWIDNHETLCNEYPCNQIIKTLKEIFKDNIITDNELASLKTLLQEILDPVSAACDGLNVDSVIDKNVCLTGDFKYGSRKDIEKILASQGAIIDKSVKKSTNYIIVGELGSTAWTSGNYGSKIKRALEFNEKYKGTVNIEIIKEDKIAHLLNKEN